MQPCLAPPAPATAATSSAAATTAAAATTPPVLRPLRASALVFLNHLEDQFLRRLDGLRAPTVARQVNLAHICARLAVVVALHLDVSARLFLQLLDGRAILADDQADAGLRNSHGFPFCLGLLNLCACVIHHLIQQSVPALVANGLIVREQDGRRPQDR